MNMRHLIALRVNRRHAVATLAASGSALLGSGPFTGRVAAATGATPPASLDSSALGLTRAGVEAHWDPGEVPITVPGRYAREFYAYPAEEGTASIAYQGLNGEEVAVYVEFRWGDDGTTEDMAQPLGARLIPADGQRTAIYLAPPTPNGPIAFTTYEYASASLTAAYGDALDLNWSTPSKILMICHERWDDSATSARIEVVSIMVRSMIRARMEKTGHLA